MRHALPPQPTLPTMPVHHVLQQAQHMVQQQHMQAQAQAQQHAQAQAQQHAQAQQFGTLMAELVHLRDVSARQAEQLDALRRLRERPSLRPSVAPPPFPHLSPTQIGDHLILQALDGSGGAASGGAASTGGGHDPGTSGLASGSAAGGAYASVRACTTPHLGVSLSASEVSFSVATPGSVQEAQLALKNSSEWPIRLVEVSCHWARRA